MLKPLKVAAAILTTATVGALSGCVTNVEGGNPEGWQQITPAEVPEIAAMVPENVRQDGTFTIGANPPLRLLNSKSPKATSSAWRWT